MVNETLISDHYAVTEYIINEKIKRIQELEAINAELLAALEAVKADAMGYFKVAYNKPCGWRSIETAEDIIARAKGAAC